MQLRTSAVGRYSIEQGGKCVESGYRNGPLRGHHSEG